MNVNVRKDYDKLSVEVGEYSADPKFNIKFLSTKPDNIADSFDFINIAIFKEDYKESASITIGKDSLEKFVYMMEEVIKAYREKNCKRDDSFVISLEAEWKIKL